MSRASIAVWLAWLAASLAAFAAGGAVVPQHGQPAGGALGAVWSWDWNWYAAIAERGYPSSPDPAFAFLPLWPGVLHACAAVGVGPWGPWLLVIAATAVLFAGVAAAHRHVDPSADPRRTAIAFACLPGSALLLVAYPDALVAAAIAWSALLAARRPAASVALLALGALARPTALLGVLPAVWGAGQRSAAWRAALVLVPTAAAGAAMAWFAARTGDLLAFSHAQEAWHRDGITALPGFIAHAVEHAELRFLLSFALVGAAVAGTALLWRRGGAYRPWAAFVASVLLVELASGRLESVPRHLALAFPLAWALALLLADRPRLRIPALVALAALNLALATTVGILAP